MKKSSAWIVLSFIFLIAVTTLSCNNSVDDMLENYNSGFTKGYVTISNTDESEYTLEPDDSGYDQNKLLFDDYTVFDIGTLNLSAPASCKSFSWVMTDPEAEDTTAAVGITFYDGESASIRRTQDYVVYIPDSGLENEHTYKLTLTVTGKAGGIFKDSCLVYIVKYYVNY